MIVYVNKPKIDDLYSLFTIWRGWWLVGRATHPIGLIVRHCIINFPPVEPQPLKVCLFVIITKYKFNRQKNQIQNALRKVFKERRRESISSMIKSGIWEFKTNKRSQDLEREKNPQQDENHSKIRVNEAYRMFLILFFSLFIRIFSLKFFVIFRQ